MLSLYANLKIHLISFFFIKSLTFPPSYFLSLDIFVLVFNNIFENNFIVLLYDSFPYLFRFPLQYLPDREPKFWREWGSLYANMNATGELTVGNIIYFLNHYLLFHRFLDLFIDSFIFPFIYLFCFFFHSFICLFIIFLIC